MNYSELNSIQKGVVGLTLVTALIHLVLGLGSSDILFFLLIFNFVGYVGLLMALYFLSRFENNREQVRIGLIAYTAITIIAYFVWYFPDLIDPLGLATKLIEVVLIVLLIKDKDVSAK